MGDLRKPHMVDFTVGGERWVCLAYDHGPFCRLCRRVDETIAACLANVDKGLMEVGQDQTTGELWFKLTEAGNEAARDLIITMSMEDELPPDPGAVSDG